jgi:murein DD-endopeptidase MepM/ murein hydrolase activator NlpD
VRRSKWIGLFIVAVMLAVVVRPGDSEAASLSTIKKQLEAAKQEMRAAEQRAANAEKQASAAKAQSANATQEKGEIEAQIAKEKASINELMAEIDNTVLQKNKTQAELDQKEAELLQTAKELDEAEDRVQARDELLQSRMRLMYTNGFVSYMDVLLSATSFSDFIDRFDALQSILSQDRDILEQQKAEKELVIIKKAEKEEQLTVVQAEYKKLEQYQAHLVKKEQEKEVAIASLNNNVKLLNVKIQKLDASVEQFESINEDQEKLLVELASKVSKLIAEENRIKNPYTGGKLGMPIQGTYRISSNFGTRIHPITGQRHTHTGMDFAAPQGTNIYAAESGIVTVARSMSGYGNAVIIDHGNGLWTVYGHIRNGGIKVSEGDSVKKGQKIAEVGSTGNSTGPHLHFEVRKNQVPVNPSGYLK